MEAVNFQKFFSEFSPRLNLLLVLPLLQASMDLGVDYNDDERKVYTSLVFQAMAVFSVGYLMAEDTNQAVVLLAVWAIIKYRSRSPNWSCY